VSRSTDKFSVSCVRLTNETKIRSFGKSRDVSLCPFAVGKEDAVNYDGAQLAEEGKFLSYLNSVLKIGFYCLSPSVSSKDNTAICSDKHP
jgi:hypothetical protein